MLNPVVGEANCMSDLIEAACLLGTAGYTSYFEDAEWMLRNHLLVSQMDDLSWVTKNEEMTNTEIHAYDNLRRRVSGAFCFGEPNGFHSYNSDLTGVGGRESQLPDNISLPMMEKGTRTHQSTSIQRSPRGSHRQLDTSILDATPGW